MNNPKSSRLSITQDNQLIEACYSMTLNEKRVLFLGISSVDPMIFPDSTVPLVCEINVDQWREYFPSDNPWRDIKDAADRLLTRYVTLHPRSGITEKITWFDSVKYMENEGRIVIKFGYSIRIRLSGMLEQFTKIDLLSVNKLKTLHSIRLYELLSQFKKTGYRKISVEDFKFSMNCSNSYARIAELKRRVLEPAMKEINNFSDMKATYREVKLGRKITDFEFFFSRPHEEEQQELPL